MYLKEFKELREELLEQIHIMKLICNGYPKGFPVKGFSYIFIHLDNIIKEIENNAK